VVTESIYGRRKIREGIVVSDKMDKTVVVAVETHSKHRLYKKIMRHVTRYKAHDEDNSCHAGDLVRILESRPLSKDKNWRVIEIVRRGTVLEAIEGEEDTGPGSRHRPTEEAPVSAEAAAPGAVMADVAPEVIEEPPQIVQETVEAAPAEAEAPAPRTRARRAPKAEEEVPAVEAAPAAEPEAQAAEPEAKPRRTRARKAEAGAPPEPEAAAEPEAEAEE